MNKKVIIISIIGVVVIAGLAVAALVYFRQSSYDPTGQAANDLPLTADLSKDFGACTMIEKSLISDTLGVDSLQGPDNIGLVHQKNDIDSQQCVYSFVDGGNIENSFNASNGFSIQVQKHANQASVDDSAAMLVADDASITVAGIGDQAAFVVRSGEGSAFTKNTLSVFSGSTRYDFAISQPTDVVTFIASDAQAKLELLARSFNY
jgi:hypothetical protein